MIHPDKHGQRSTLGSDHALVKLGALTIGWLKSIKCFLVPNALITGAHRLRSEWFSLSCTCNLPFFFPDEYALAEYKTPCSPPSNWNQIRARRSNGSEGIRQATVEAEEDERLGCFWEEEWGISKSQIPVDPNDLFWSSLQKSFGVSVSRNLQIKHFS